MKGFSFVTLVILLLAHFGASAQITSIRTGPSNSEIAEHGQLIPTVYYFALMDEDNSRCQTSERRPLVGAGGVNIMKVCPRTLAVCGEQGSCAIIQNKRTLSFNILGRVAGQDRYFRIEENGCRFGYGVNSSCLDPFFTLAADLNVYKPGDVIYVPKVNGMLLPNGKVHDGYFIVRDQGRGITGKGRFDFFSGFYSWRNQSNPFVKVGLRDQTNRFEYMRVTGPKAQQVRRNRAFPALPSRPVATMPSSDEIGIDDLLRELEHDRF